MKTLKSAGGIYRVIPRNPNPFYGDFPAGFPESHLFPFLIERNLMFSP